MTDQPRPANLTGRALLEPDQVREMRQLYASTKDYKHLDPDKWTYQKLATKYGLKSKNTVRNIIDHVSYDWVR